MSRGPATVHDFAKWSGLTVADAQSGLEAVKARLEQRFGGRSKTETSASLQFSGKRSFGTLNVLGSARAAAFQI